MRSCDWHSQTSFTWSPQNLSTMNFKPWPENAPWQHKQNSNLLSLCFNEGFSMVIWVWTCCLINWVLQLPVLTILTVERQVFVLHRICCASCAEWPCVSHKPVWEARGGLAIKNKKQSYHTEGHSKRNPSKNTSLALMYFHCHNSILKVLPSISTCRVRGAIRDQNHRDRCDSSMTARRWIKS